MRLSVHLRGVRSHCLPDLLSNPRSACWQFASKGNPKAPCRRRLLVPSSRLKDYPPSVVSLMVCRHPHPFHRTSNLTPFETLALGLNPKASVCIFTFREIVFDRTLHFNAYCQSSLLTICTDNSANSQGLQVHTLLNPDESPSRQSIPSTPLSARVPNSAGSALPSINQGFNENANRDSYGRDQPMNRDSYASGNSYNRDSLGRELNRDSYGRDSRDLAPHLDSRRSSVDSRMHQGFNNLYINSSNMGPGSPYESANTSQVSLAASLRRPNGQPMSPLSARSSVRGQPAPRIAPPIMPVGRRPDAPDPTAEKPTQGYAWAFPDSAIPEERRGSDSGESSVDHNVSRQNSYAASSIRSSIFSNDSQLPQGQRRFEGDGIAAFFPPFIEMTC